MDDRAVGLVLRALRRRRGWRQADLALAAGCSQALVSNVEAGQLGRTPVERLRALFGAVEARLVLEPRWRGADLDRLLDADHAAIVASVIGRLERAGWTTVVEVTYSEFGERGSIDVLALRPSVRAALVVEVKSDVGSSEAVGRKLDEKGRLAPTIVRSRFGWTPAIVGCVLVLPESSRLRRLMERQAAPLAHTYPIDAHRIASWLRQPNGPLAATWFLSGITPRNTRRARPANPRHTRPPGTADQTDASVDQPNPGRPPTILR